MLEWISTVFLSLFNVLFISRISACLPWNFLHFANASLLYLGLSSLFHIPLFLFVFIFQCWGLNTGHTPWATPPALFCDTFSQDRVLWTICLGWLRTRVLLISASRVARITDVSHQCLAPRSSWSFWPINMWLGVFSIKFHTQMNLSGHWP
jgi:hypothetical protein